MTVEPGKFMLYWAGALVVFILILFRRPKAKGMRLRLRGTNPGGATERAVAHRDPAFADGSSSEPPPAAPRERVLNVVFNYNGHSWDAYEVLGLPAGTNLDSVRAAFAEALESVDPTSRPFVEAAYRAIVAQWDRVLKG